MEAFKYIGILFVETAVISGVIAAVIWAVNEVLSSERFTKEK